MTPFQALFRADLRRGFAQAKTAPLITAAFVFALVVVAGDGAPGAAMALGGSAFLYGGGLGGAALVDRFNGTLDFLAGLPVQGRVVALARLAAIATLNVLGGLQIAAALALLADPPLSAVDQWIGIAVMGIGSWAALTTVVFTGVALVTRYGTTAAMHRIMIGFIAFVAAALYLMELLVPDVEALQVRLLTTPWHIAVPAFLALCGGVAWWSVGVMARGIDRYVPTPDSITL